MSDSGVERSLRSLRGEVAFPPTPDIVSGVMGSLPSHPAKPRVRRVIAVAAAAVVLAMGLVVAIPATRQAVARMLGLGGVAISHGQAPGSPGALGTNLDLGSPTTLAQVRRRVSFAVWTPARLQAPDAVFLSREVPGGKVSLAYHSTTTLPEAPENGWGALVTEFKAPVNRILMKKLATTAQVRPVELRGSTAYWVRGRHIVYWFNSTDGSVLDDTIRFAPNTLLWERDGVTIRLESELTLSQALRIARSSP